MDIEPQPKPRIVDKQLCVIELFSSSGKPSEGAALKIDGIGQNYRGGILNLQYLVKKKIRKIELNGGVRVLKEPLLVTKDTVIQVQYMTRTGTLEVLEISADKKVKKL